MNAYNLLSMLAYAVPILVLVLVLACAAIIFFLALILRELRDQNTFLRQDKLEGEAEDARREQEEAKLFNDLSASLTYNPFGTKGKLSDLLGSQDKMDGPISEAEEDAQDRYRDDDDSGEAWKKNG